MRLKPGVSEEVTRAVRAFQTYATDHVGSVQRVIRQFCREWPEEVRVLIEAFDATHPGLNYVPARYLTSTTTKVRVALQDAWETDGRWHKWTQSIRRHRFVFSVILPVLLLPILLSPNHPLAVYGYLFDSYNPSLTPEAFAFTGSDLTSFLTSQTQVQRYRADLLDDMLDRRSSKFFVLVRRPDGTLRHESIRTWNGFLPEGLPLFLGRRLDRKELPYLSDEVETWLRDNEIVARGHYHAFGGVPSSGDTVAQWFSDLPEIVVVNGIVPMIYLDGEVVPYHEDVVIANEVFAGLRSIELSLMMDVTQELSWSEEPSPALRSFLGFLNRFQNVDVSKLEDVARCIRLLSVDFKNNHRSVFVNGLKATAYENDPDVAHFLHNLTMVRVWSDLMSDPRNHVPNDKRVEGRRHAGIPNSDDTG